MFVNIGLIMCLLLHIFCERDVILIKAEEVSHPSEICSFYGLEDVISTPTNLPYLMSMLHNNDIDSGFVAGWNDIVTFNFVLRSNGALAPYDMKTNPAKYAFCMGRDKTFSYDMHKYKQENCKPHPICPPCPPCHEPEPTPVHPKPHPCPPCPPCEKPEAPEPMPCPPCPEIIVPPKPEPMPCPPCPPGPEDIIPPKPKPEPCPPCPHTPESEVSEESEDVSSSSSSCYESESEETEEHHESISKKSCPKYVRHKRIISRSQHKADPCKDQIKLAVEDLRIIKTFIFNERDLKNCKKIKLKEVDFRAARKVQMVELMPILDGKRISKDGYPALLRFPHFLLQFKRHIIRKYEEPNACLYLDNRGRLYVRIENTLYMVRFRRKMKKLSTPAFNYIKLCAIKGRALDCLIKEGLSGVLFEQSC